jgi:hypothetical protein
MIACIFPYQWSKGKGHEVECYWFCLKGKYEEEGVKPIHLTLSVSPYF